MSFELPLIFLILALMIGTRFIPPELRCLSSRNRRAVRLALREFTETHDVKPRKMHVRIYESDREQRIVMIPHTSDLHPPILAFYSVSNVSDRTTHIGSGQCHWGIRPEDVWRNHSKNVAS